MEKVMSVEERIRRAEDIYLKRKNMEQNLNNNYARVSINPKKDYRLLKKLIIQIVICLIIYFLFYFVANNQYVFSDSFTNKVKEVLSYDIDFEKIFNDFSNYINSQIIELEEENSNIESDQNKEEKNNLEKKKEEDTVVQESNGDKGDVVDNKNELNEVENVKENIEKEINQEDENSRNNNVDNIGGAEEITNELSQMEQDCIDIKNITNFIIPVERLYKF